VHQIDTVKGRFESREGETDSRLKPIRCGAAKAAFGVAKPGRGHGVKTPTSRDVLFFRKNTHPSWEEAAREEPCNRLNFGNKKPGSGSRQTFMSGHSIRKELPHIGKARAQHKEGGDHFVDQERQQGVTLMPTTQDTEKKRLQSSSSSRCSRPKEKGKKLRMRTIPRSTDTKRSRTQQAVWF